MNVMCEFEEEEKIKRSHTEIEKLRHIFWWIDEVHNYCPQRHRGYIIRTQTSHTLIFEACKMYTHFNKWNQVL